MEKEENKTEEIVWTDEMKQAWLEENKEYSDLTEAEQKEFQDFLNNVKITSKPVKPNTKLHDWMRFLHDMMYYKPGDEEPESLKDVFERHEIIKKAYTQYKELLETPKGAKEFWDREQYLREHPEEQPSGNFSITMTITPAEEKE